MKADKQELIDVQLQRAQESFTMAELAGEAGYWNSAASKLYYAFFNLVRVLFTLDDIDAQTHTGIKSLFSLKFIKEKQLDEKWGKLFARLFDYRQKGNYGNLRLTENLIHPLISQVAQFRIQVLALLEQAGYKINNES